MNNSKDFVFGVATSSYQIEGGINEGGRTPSIWDDFVKLPGRVLNGDTGEVACDHFHRYKEDITLMKELGVGSYRFSISWSRIFPQEGLYNPEGMEFYKDIIRELKKHGMTAMVTLYHWDLPSWAEEKGGWLNREVVDWFCDYSKKCFEELDEEVEYWITHNEPFCASFVSYLEGRHAPGHKNVFEAVTAAHHMLLSHGKAVNLYREIGCKQIGITLNLTPAYPASDSYGDRIAANNRNGYTNRWFLDAVIYGKYPADMVNIFAMHSKSDFSFIWEKDMEVISTTCDFLGVNYYSRVSVEFDSTLVHLARNAYHTDFKKNAMGWDLSSKAFRDLVEWIRKEYTQLPIYITENGSAWEDVLEEDNIHDKDRVEYLNQHLNEILEMNKDGLDIKGYYYWSFMDNFEWGWGYTRRFGLVYIDYDTQKRIPKDSFYAYKRFIQLHVK